MSTTHDRGPHHRPRAPAPAAPWRRPRTVYVPRLDPLEARIALSCDVNYDAQANQLTVVHDPGDQVEVSAVQSDGGPAHVKVICNGDTQSEFDTATPPSVVVQTRGDGDGAPRNSAYARIKSVNKNVGPVGPLGSTSQTSVIRQFGSSSQTSVIRQSRSIRVGHK